MSPACHVSTEIHKLLEHESERPEGTPIIRLPPSGSRLSWFRDVAADGFGLMCIHHDQPDGVPPLPERYRVRRSSNTGVLAERLETILRPPSLISGRAGLCPNTISISETAIDEDGAELLDISHAQIEAASFLSDMAIDLSMRPPNPAGYRMSVEVRSSDGPLLRLASGFWMGERNRLVHLSVAAAFSQKRPSRLG